MSMTPEQRKALECALLKEWMEAFERARVARTLTPELAYLCSAERGAAMLPQWMYDRASQERDAANAHLEFVEAQIRKVDE